MKSLSVFKEERKKELDGSLSQKELIKEIENLKLINKSSIEYIPINLLNINPKFSQIFSIKSELLESLSQNMLEKGFDINHPIFLWKKNNEIIDGHTRFQAAKIANISEVPVIFLDFLDEEKVIEYLYSLQLDRRNMSLKDKTIFLINYIKNLGYRPKFFREWVSKFFHISQGTAQKILTLIDNKDSDIFEKFMNDEFSLNKAFDRIVTITQNNKTIKNHEISYDFQKLNDANLNVFFNNIALLPIQEKTLFLENLEQFLIMLINCQFLSKKKSIVIFEYIQKLKSSF